MSRIRITGGEWRSRLVQVIDAPGLRPTPDRVRETLFNWLGQDLAGLACLDLFAGSGALGFEAASRGAARVVLVERDRRVFTHLEAAARLFATPRLTLRCCDAIEFALSARPEFDLVFLDPPYGKGWLERVEPHLPKLANPEAVIYAESDHPIESLGHWRTAKRGKAGQVFYHLMERE